MTLIGLHFYSFLYFILHTSVRSGFHLFIHVFPYQAEQAKAEAKKLAEKAEKEAKVSLI